MTAQNSAPYLEGLQQLNAEAGEKDREESSRESRERAEEKRLRWGRAEKLRFLCRSGW